MAVAQQDDSWKVVKDVVRNLIDGQPKKVELSNSVCWCRFQSQDDAVQAYGMNKQSFLLSMADRRQIRGSDRTELV